MGVMSEIYAEIQPLIIAKSEAFEVYNTLLNASSPLHRTAEQDHEIHMARMNALAAREALDNYQFWRKFR